MHTSLVSVRARYRSVLPQNYVST